MAIQTVDNLPNSIDISIPKIGEGKLVKTSENYDRKSTVIQIQFLTNQKLLELFRLLQTEVQSDPLNQKMERKLLTWVVVQVIELPYHLIMKKLFRTYMYNT